MLLAHLVLGCVWSWNLPNLVQKWLVFRHSPTALHPISSPEERVACARLCSSHLTHIEKQNNICFFVNMSLSIVNQVGFCILSTLLVCISSLGMVVFEF